MAYSFSERIKRLLRHKSMTAAKGRRMFPPETLLQIGAAISEGEQRHRGELRLIVENAMPSDAIWSDLSNRERARELFAEYAIWDTEDNCGVLIYVNLAEHKVDIVVDRNIGRQIDAATWQQVCKTMTGAFARAQFEAGTLEAVAQVNHLLATHFPANGARLNELPDHPIVL
jgi:uncharacterized membrane protein